MTDATRIDFENAINFLSSTDPASLAELNVAEWFNLCVALKHFGLLCMSVSKLREVAPAVVSRKVEIWKRHHDFFMRRRSAMLAYFSEESRRQNLHFVVMKGMALSKLLYGDAFARQSGDIDILVAPDDVAKADYVARSCGWYQPGEARLVRPLQNSGKLDVATLQRLQSPYTLRSNVILPHMTNYYFPYGDGSSDSLEVHDRFHGIPSSCTGSLLWDLQEVEIDGVKYLTPSNELSLIVSVLSLHEDAETIRANTSTRLTMGVKACFDISSFLQAESHVPIHWDTLTRHVSTLGISDWFTQSVSDARMIFPCECELPEIFRNSADSIWNLPYMERLLDFGYRACAGLETISNCLLNSIPSPAVQEHLLRHQSDWDWLPSNGGSDLTSFLGRTLKLPSGDAELSWRLPIWSACLLGRLVLQGVILCPGVTPNIGYRINVFLENGEWNGFVQEMTVNSVDGHANRIARGDPVRVEAQHAQDAIEVTAQIGLSLKDGSCSSIAVLSIWECVYGQLYRKIAGIDSMEMLELLLES